MSRMTRIKVKILFCVCHFNRVPSLISKISRNDNCFSDFTIVKSITECRLFITS